MELFTSMVSKINSFAWGPVMIIFLVGTGILLSLGTRFIQFRKLGLAFKLLFSKDHSGSGDITPFQALMTSLSATIGTGNIAGVATAVALGGPGSRFLDVGYCSLRRSDQIRRSCSGYPLPGSK